MEHLESLARLEERIQRAVEMIQGLKQETRRLEVAAAQLTEKAQAEQRRAEALSLEKEDLLREGRVLREKQQEWQRFEHDRDEIRTRIDGMLAKFEELEI